MDLKLGMDKSPRAPIQIRVLSLKHIPPLCTYQSFGRTPGCYNRTPTLSGRIFCSTAKIFAGPAQRLLVVVHNRLTSQAVQACDMSAARKIQGLQADQILHVLDALARDVLTSLQVQIPQEQQS